jgi:hypothetical protein
MESFAVRGMTYGGLQFDGRLGRFLVETGARGGANSARRPIIWENAMTYPTPPG